MVATVISTRGVGCSVEVECLSSLRPAAGGVGRSRWADRADIQLGRPVQARHHAAGRAGQHPLHFGTSAPNQLLCMNALHTLGAGLARMLQRLPARPRRRPNNRHGAGRAPLPD